MVKYLITHSAEYGEYRGTVGYVNSQDEALAMIANLEKQLENAKELYARERVVLGRINNHSEWDCGEKIRQRTRLFSVTEKMFDRLGFRSTPFLSSLRFYHTLLIELNESNIRLDATYQHMCSLEENKEN